MLPFVLTVHLLMACGPRVPPPELAPSAAPVVSVQARTHYLRGQLLLAHDDLPGAAEAFALALMFDPQSPWIRLAQGDVHLAAGNFAAARNSWEEAAAVDPTCAEAWLRVARIRRLMGDTEGAVEPFRKAVLTGADWRADAGLVDVLEQTGHPDEAQAALEQWASRASADRHELRERGRRRLSMDDAQGAQDDLGAYLAQQPEDARALDLYLTAVSRTRRRGTALAVLDQMQVALPADPRVAEARFELAVAVGDAPRALDALLLRDQLAGGKDAEVLADLARAQLQLGRPHDALASLDRARAVDGDPRVRARAEAYEVAGQAKEALAVHLLVELNTPEDEVDRARLQRAAGHPDLASALLAHALEESPDSYVLLQAAAEHAMATGEVEVALQYVDRMGALSPGERVRNRARLLVRDGRPDAALDALRAAHTEWPDDVGVSLDLAELLLASGRAPEAVTLLEASLDLAPGAPELLYELGLAQDRAGTRERALATLNALLATDPAHAEALGLVASLYARQGVRLDEAERLALRALDLAPADGAHMVTLAEVQLARGKVEDARRTLDRAGIYALHDVKLQGRIELDRQRAGQVP